MAAMTMNRATPDTSRGSGAGWSAVFLYYMLGLSARSGSSGLKRNLPLNVSFGPDRDLERHFDHVWVGGLRVDFELVLIGVPTGNPLVFVLAVVADLNALMP